tara:strand:+ start:150 stop:401 length:252 start_codon:yes stop_codon:yes gene_type:complete
MLAFAKKEGGLSRVARLGGVPTVGACRRGRFDNYNLIIIWESRLCELAVTQNSLALMIALGQMMASFVCVTGSNVPGVSSDEQ